MGVDHRVALVHGSVTTLPNARVVGLVRMTLLLSVGDIIALENSVDPPR